MKKRGSQSNLGDALGSLVRRLDKKSGGAYRQMRVAQVWSDVAGDTVASHTTGAHLREGELVVLVDSPLWATELSALSEHYRTSINQELGQEMVRSVRFTVSGKVKRERDIEEALKDSREELTRDKVEPIPLSGAERQQVEASVSSIPDEELRSAVLKATVADLEWKKGLRARRERETPPEAV